MLTSNSTYLKGTVVFRKKSCKFEHGLENKNEFEKWPLIQFVRLSAKVDILYYENIFL